MFLEHIQELFNCRTIYEELLTKKKITFNENSFHHSFFTKESEIWNEKLNHQLGSISFLYSISEFFNFLFSTNLIFSFFLFFFSIFIQYFSKDSSISEISRIKAEKKEEKVILCRDEEKVSWDWQTIKDKLACAHLSLPSVIR